MKELYIMPKDFTNWNDILGKALPAYKEQIVLKRNIIIKKSTLK